MRTRWPAPAARATWLRLAAVCLVGMSAAPAAIADAIIITQAMKASTIAEVFIGETSVRVELEIGGPDLEGLRHLMPDAVYERLGYDRELWRDRLARFFAEDLTFRANGRDPLPGRLLEIEPRPRVRRDEITGEPLPPAEGETETVVYAVLEYFFDGRPAALEIRGPTNERGAATASIGFITYHLGLPVMDFRYLAREQTIDLDWEDPWYSRFRSRNLRRQYDSPMNAFLYVEPYEVRTEIIARPKDLQQWVDLGLEGRETIPVETQFEIKQRAAAFLAERYELTIDGRPVEPVLDRVNFLRRTLRTSTVVDPPVELDAVSATLGVIYVFPTDGLPQEVNLTWDLFSDRIRRVPGAATDEAGPLRSFLQPDDNVLWWRNVLKNPTIPTLVEISPPPGGVFRVLSWSIWALAAGFLAIAVVQTRSRLRGAATSRRALTVAGILLVLIAVFGFVALPSRMTHDKNREIVGALLHNVYRAFDFRDESTIYDALDRSVTGELLTRIYLETRRGLELASQGGARAKVQAIELLEAEPRRLRGEPGFVARCVWTVAGSVGHWGHVHTRTNRYEADLTIQPVNGRWKITGLEVLEEVRL